MYYLSIAAIFQQENSWLDEWIRYHAGVGAEHFWLFNHDENPTVSSRILKPYTESNLVEEISVSGHSVLGGVPQRDMQTYVIKEALRLASGKTYWLALIDLDEFLLPRREDDLRTVFWERRIETGTWSTLPVARKKDCTNFPVEFQIDWVKAWQFTDPSVGSMTKE